MFSFIVLLFFAMEESASLSNVILLLVVMSNKDKLHSSRELTHFEPLASGGISSEHFVNDRNSDDESFVGSLVGSLFGRLI